MQKNGALSGIKVLDLSRLLPGPYCSMILADHGAQVIAVEDKRFLTDDLFITTINRNKEHMSLDLKTEGGKEIFFRLVKDSDVLMEGFRPGVTKKLKVDYETLQQINPRLIYCSLTGFGQDGPYANLPGHDMNYVGISGALSLIGPRDGAPCMPSNLLADAASAGLNGTIGILLALVAREGTGKGQFVDISYLDGVLSLVDEAAYYFLAGIVPKRGETYLTGSAPYANVYLCKDNEYITLGCIEAPFWVKLCTVIGREDLIPLQQAEGDEKEMVFEALRDIFVTKTI